jgi:P27 family predicted phage terminase small subunit
MATRGPKPRLKTVIPLRQSWEPPSHLGASARREFERVVDLLRQRGTLDQADSELVARRSELVEIAVDAYQQQRKEPFVTSDRGNLAPHPGIRVHNAACATIRLIDVELGLTPARAAKGKATSVDASGYGTWAKYLGGVEP